LNGLDFNLDDSEAEMDSLVAPLPPSEPNMRPKVLPMGSKDIAPPAPKTPPESQFIRAAKGVSNSGNAVAAPERNSAIVARSTEVCQPRGRFSIVVLIHHFVVASVTIPFHGFR
jgi:cell division septation protein DedD